MKSYQAPQTRGEEQPAYTDHFLFLYSPDYMSPKSKSTTSEYPQLLDIDVGEDVFAVTFTANGEHLVSGSKKGIQVWGVEDGKRVATMPVPCGAYCVAVSSDGRWIAGGTKVGGVVVWNATTYKQVFADGYKSTPILDVDFSPDSTRLISADGVLNTATIWDFVAHRKVRILRKDSDEGWLLTAKYSPQGDRVATVTHESVRVWDTNNGRLLVNVNVPMKGLHDLLWCNDHLLVKTGDAKIMRISAATGLTVSEWPVPYRDPFSCIALPQHGKFVAYSTKKTVAIWDTVTHTQLSPIPHTHEIRSITWGLDGQLLAISAAENIIVKDLSCGILPIVLGPHIDNAALDAWKQGRLTNAEALLSAAIPVSKGRAHHVLACRALVRARLGLRDAALADAEKSTELQQSLVGYVAKCVALIGKGEKHKGFQACDIAFKHFQGEHIAHLRLVKAIILSMAGEHVDAISCMDDLITDAGMEPALYAVQAYMHLLLGEFHVKSGNYERATRSFEDARIRLGDNTDRPPLIVSLISGWRFDDLAITIRKCLCEALLAMDSMQEAVESILRMVDQETNMTEPMKTWVSDFKHRCCGKLEDIGDSVLNDKQYNEAVSQYTTALSLDPASPQDLLVKRSKAHAMNRTWKDALNDANDVIKFDPSSPLGYERKYIALLGMGRHDDARQAFDIMLSKISESSDPGIRERSRRYVRPEQTMEAIRSCIENVIRDLPSVLINVFSGRLCNKSEQAAAFELTPDFTEFLTSMPTHIDHTLIEQVVRKFYRYATLSHTWEGNEPLYEKVIKIVVYDLEPFPTHEKLRMLCKIAREEGFTWAWSDTCCIDKGDHFVLQEALVSMFKWYEGSAMTVIFLYDVDRLAVFGALMKSKWNSRGWTLQEYHASQVVRIYTKDWTPYLGLTIYNHKESPEIISEMEQATGVLAHDLVTLRPGLSDIRQKLRLASTRQTTRVEDAAYSLLGIFSMTLPATYGEGDRALGRLLSQLLMSSGDTSILAWTGKSGSFNSCLPTNIVVFDQPLTQYIPPAISNAEMGAITAGLHASALDPNLVTRLYDEVDRLPTPTFAGQRMRLPCLAFKIRLLSRRWVEPEFVFSAQAGVLGVVEIKTKEIFTPQDFLYLVHPWIDFLLNRRASRKKAEVVPDEKEAPGWDEFLSFDTDFSSTSLVYEFLARLRQPFGALLLASNQWNVAEFRRVSTDNLITVQMEEITSAMLEVLIRGVRVLDVL